MVNDSAHSTEAAMKTASATSIICRLPNVSPRRPYTGAAIVEAMRYESTIQGARSIVPSFAAITGNAVATIV
jgi:hypothetical protein